MIKSLILTTTILVFAGCVSTATFQESTETAVENPILYPFFDEYEMGITSSSHYEGVEKVEMVITSVEAIRLYSSLNLKNESKNLDGIIVEEIEEGKKWNISIFFPASGEYEFRLYGISLSSTEDIAYGIADFLFSAEVETAGTVYVLNSVISENMDKIGITDIENITDGEWRVSNSSWYTEYNTGVIADDYELVIKNTVVFVNKGTAVTFHTYGIEINDITFLLEDNIELDLGNYSIPFKKGTEILLGSNISGFSAEDLDLSIRDNELKFPEGSYMTFRNGDLTSVDINGSGIFTICGKPYSCTGPVYISNYGDVFSIYLETSTEVNVISTDTLFTAPEGSELYFENDNINSATFPEKLEIDVTGKTIIVEKNYMVLFDEEGHFDEILEPKEYE